MSVLFSSSLTISLHTDTHTDQHMKMASGGFKRTAHLKVGCMVVSTIKGPQLQPFRINTNDNVTSFCLLTTQDECFNVFEV